MYAEFTEAKVYTITADENKYVREVSVEDKKQKLTLLPVRQ